MPRLLLLNHVVLFLCCSIYIGTGVSLVFFQFPLEPRLTPDNYAMIFVEPVTYATQFFTYMTIVMLVTGAVMLFTEWFTGIRWVPIVVLAAVVASTALTILFIFPYNKELNDGISDPERLKYVFSKWADLNRIRVSLWTVSWVAMMYWFYRMAYLARADR
ncbi:MAG TPA: hypothetical protein VMS43_11565 [Allosphingosinicella sp.]|nr:hypothetical protein [Allosphingosinicella sp.]